MCKVAVALRYLPVVWSAKYGPFIEEYQKNNIMVEIVPEKELTKPETIQRVQAFDMAVCNTIVKRPIYRISVVIIRNGYMRSNTAKHYAVSATMLQQQFTSLLTMRL